MAVREIVITEAEKAASTRKGKADLKAWRERNPDAPRGLPVRKPVDAKIVAKARAFEGIL